MMVETKNWTRLGSTTWHCAVFWDDGNASYAEYLADAERPNLGLAKAWIARTLPRFWRPGKPGHVWGRIERGTYEDSSFNDDEYGEVADATWERDERPGAEWFAGLASDKIAVVWAED